MLQDYGPGHSDFPALKGSWIVASLQGFEERFKAECIKRLRLLIGTHARVCYGKDAVLATFRLHSTEDPSQIDATLHQGPEDLRGKTFPGIYLLEGNSLTMIFRGPDESRPTEFITDGKIGIYKASFEREPPLWEKNPALFDILVARARERYGHGQLGDEAVSEIASRFSNASTFDVQDPVGWSTTTVRNQLKELKRRQNREKRPHGHLLQPLTTTNVKKDGNPVEVERPELADSGWSAIQLERQENLRKARREYVVWFLGKYGPLAIHDLGDEHQSLMEALLRNVISVLTGRLQDRKDLATLRIEYGVSNVNYQRKKLIAAIARRATLDGLSREALVAVLGEFDPDDFYNVVDDTKATPLQSREGK